MCTISSSAARGRTSSTRQRGRRAAARRLGRRDRRAPPGLPIYLSRSSSSGPRTLLGVVDPDEGRVREGGRPAVAADHPPTASRNATSQILLYSVLLFAVTQLPFCGGGGLGAIYLVASALLGMTFIGLRGRAVHGGPRAGPRCACTCSRSSTWRCCSRRWSRRGAVVPSGRIRPDGSEPHPPERPGRPARRRRVPRRVRPDLRRRGRLCSVRARPGAPPVGEEIHLPGGSVQPLLLTIGLTIGLVGVASTPS